MDSQTHWELGLKLMSAVGAHPHLAIASLFPQIDRKPHTLHRLHAHNVYRAKSVTALGLKSLFLHAGFLNPLLNSYESRRFTEEKDRFQKYLEQCSEEFRRPDIQLEPALLAYVSHLYLDTFNQPIQPFAPFTPYCSGQWDLWKKLGDFRLKLYTTHHIGDLRSLLFTNALWKAIPDCGSSSFIEAMLMRLCELSEGAIPNIWVKKGMQSLELDAADPNGAREAHDFLMHFEALLCELHLKVLSDVSPSETSSRITLAPILR